jgi:hypothetical protein
MSAAGDDVGSSSSASAAGDDVGSSASSKADGYPDGRFFDAESEEVRRQALEDFVRSLPVAGAEGSLPRTEVDCSDHCAADGQEGNLYCTYRRYREGAWSNDFMALQPNSATLFPGNVLRGEDGVNGVLTPLGVPLAPMSFSVSLENLDGNPTGHMESTSLSAYRVERNRILSAGMAGVTVAAMDFEITEVHSEAHLSLQLGVGAEWPGVATLRGDFNWDSEEESTKVLMQFTQRYYSVDLDLPTGEADFFAPHVRASQLADRVGDGIAPVYVQSVVYGRRVLFTVESRESAQSLRAALEATCAIPALGDAAPEVTINTERDRVLRNSTIRAHLLGGNAESATAVIDGPESMREYLRSGGNYDADSPGAPIAYTLAYLDHTPARAGLTTEYTARTCLRNRADLDVVVASISSINGRDVESGLWGDLDVSGWVRLRYPTEDNPVLDCSTGGEVVTIWEVGDGSWVSVPADGQWAPENPPSQSVAGLFVDHDSQICLSAMLTELDLGYDDSLGNVSRLVRFDAGWPGQHLLRLQGEGSAVAEVTIDITLR